MRKRVAIKVLERWTAVFMAYGDPRPDGVHPRYRRCTTRRALRKREGQWRNRTPLGFKHEIRRLARRHLARMGRPRPREVYPRRR